MFQHTQAAALGEPVHEALAPFRVESPIEVHALLRLLRDTSTQVVLSAAGGSTLVAELWSLDVTRQRLNFTADDNNPVLQTLVDADEAVAVAYLDSVKLQFDLHDLLLVRAVNSCAMQSAMPAVVYRFQRRSAYRVRTLERHSPSARLRHPAIPDMRLALRVLDVSIGGCALLVPADVPSLEPGLSLHGVQIELDADTRFTATLQLQHMSSINSRAQGLRAGCEWRMQDRESERALQRYIDQTQKRRRMLSLD